ncbi:MAG TPA: hypothetical protein VIB39_22920 [Candidatus Angelobacter sp.]|jgi:hypothetical protein
MDLRKVYGGTPVGQASCCDTCVYARIIRGYAQSERITLCDRIFRPLHIPFPVSECTDYVDKRLPCIEDLEQIAWELRSKSAGKRAGFRVAGPPADLPDEPEEAQPAEQPQEVPAAAKTD